MIFRKKLRYILVEAADAINMSDPQTPDGLKREMLDFLGQLQYFKANPQVSAQLSEKVFVMSMNRGYERGVTLALSFIKNLNGKGVGFYTIRTSGTMRNLKDYFRKEYKTDLVPYN